MKIHNTDQPRLDSPFQYQYQKSFWHGRFKISFPPPLPIKSRASHLLGFHSLGKKTVVHKHTLHLKISADSSVPSPGFRSNEKKTNKRWGRERVQNSAKG